MFNKTGLVLILVALHINFIGGTARIVNFYSLFMIREVVIT